MRNTILTILALIFLFSWAYANFIFLEYSATPSTNSVVIEWVTKSETGVNRFAILRSPDDENFREIGSVVAKNVGSNYSYTDDNVVFKESQTFFYKLRALKEDGTIVEETEQSLIVHPNISGIYRTWGAIKAMFQ
jgi:hypothetical protein